MKDKGFTLLEIIISVAIIAIIAILIAQAFFTTTRTNTNLEIRKEVKQNGDYALGTIERMIHNARTVTSPCSDSGITSSSVSLINPDDAITTFGCVLGASGTRLASQSAGRTDYLTGTTLTLGGASCTESSLAFTCRSIGGVPDTITVTFRLTQITLSPLASDRPSTLFQTTVGVRNK